MTIDRSEIERLKSQVDLRDLLDRYTELHRESAAEMAGPCPKCGGRDRLHVKRDWFFCRQCLPHGGDLFIFWSWLEGLTFAEAVERTRAYLGAATPVGHRKAEPREIMTQQNPAWRDRAGTLVDQAVSTLAGKAGGPGRAYLEGRGLTASTWQHWGIGFHPAVALPGTGGDLTAPAIVLPWYDPDGGLVAVRYRFLERHTYRAADGRERTVKQTSLAGSMFGGRYYGTHAGLLGCAERWRWLVICEGEINAMSVWQAALGTAVDVVSLGSESAAITPAMAELAGRYRKVITWADRAEVARRWRDALPGAFGIRSPQGRDANDLLREGKLSGFLAGIRAQAAGGNLDDLQAVRADLLDLERLNGRPLEPWAAYILADLDRVLGCVTVTEGRGGAFAA